MLHWSIEKIILPLKYTWKISRNASDEKINFIIRVTDDVQEGRGEVAPNIRYEETPDTIENNFRRFLEKKPEDIRSVESLSDLLKECGIKGALRFGIESAYIHNICGQNSVPEYLGLPRLNAVPISFSIPIMDIGRIKSFFKEQKLERFQLIKIKVNAEEAYETIAHLSSFCEAPIIIDANEAFTDPEQSIYFSERVRKFRIEFIEQPMPSSSVEESLYIKKYVRQPLFADESVVDEADFGLLKEMFDGVNVKLMKAGGYLNAIRMLREARSRGMKTMLGCMVETTLGISGGLNLCSLADYADLDSFLTIKNEPFSLVKEENGRILYSKKD